MIGAIAGDIIGSVYEFQPTKRTDFKLFAANSTFTDDTVLTVAIADAILTKTDYAKALRDYGRSYPGRGYGGYFSQWLGRDDASPYNSYGNGSAMRASPVGYAFATLEEVLGEAERSASVTHNHPEGIKGAQAVATAVFLARRGEDKVSLRKSIEERFGYRLGRTLKEIRPDYRFDETCQGTVPEAIVSFLESEDFETAVRNAVSLGGDSDTLACITGGIAEAYYGMIPDSIVVEVRARLDPKLLKVVNQFRERSDLERS